MGCAFSICTCYFIDPQGSGWCSFKRITNACACCVHAGNWMSSRACCLCLGMFQDAVMKNDQRLARRLMWCLPANIGSGVRDACFACMLVFRGARCAC